MKAGQTLKKDGRQVLLWPLPICNITQTSGANSASHCCGKPVDAVGSGATAPLYAPCDCHLVYSDGYATGNTRAFTSDAPVITPAGVRTVTFSFTHANNPPTKTKYKQGELIYYTGTAGFVAGDHVHIDQSKNANAGLVYYGVTCAWGNACYALSGSDDPTKFWYMNGTDIRSTGGLKFQTFTGGITGSTVSGSDNNKSDLNWYVPSKTGPLTEEQVQNNAKCFYGYMHLIGGWTLEAVCGALGNIVNESGLNPNRWQNDDPNHSLGNYHGFGLTQWTPWYKIVNYLKSKGVWEIDYPAYGKVECDRILEEVEAPDNQMQWMSVRVQQHMGVKLTFPEYIKLKKTPEYCSDCFLYGYEGPANMGPVISGMRQRSARSFYNQLKNWKPVLPGTLVSTKEDKGKMPLWMMLRPR